MIESGQYIREITPGSPTPFTLKPSAGPVLGVLLIPPLHPDAGDKTSDVAVPHS